MTCRRVQRKGTRPRVHAAAGRRTEDRKPFEPELVEVQGAREDALGEVQVGQREHGGVDAPDRSHPDDRIGTEGFFRSGRYGREGVNCPTTAIGWVRRLSVRATLACLSRSKRDLH